VKELPTHFELHGELAGINQSDVTIEFTDPQTLSIRGRSERTYTAGTPPTAIEAEESVAAITEDGTHTPKSDHQPTVEDEDEPTTTVAAPEAVKPQQQQQQQKPKEPEERYWVSERSVGSFARAFTFPGRIDQDAVTASMKDGILTVVVPKAKKHESRKIEIN
jgi:HSP20 family molecular chaperone IbpA